jgi:hypothetical protein
MKPELMTGEKLCEGNPVPPRSNIEDRLDSVQNRMISLGKRMEAIYGRVQC